MVQGFDPSDLIAQPFHGVDLPLPEKQSGKVRDWYSIPDEKRLIVTTDRLSAFDRVLAAVPYKGQVLNQLSAWWFSQTAGHHPEPRAEPARSKRADRPRSGAVLRRSHRARLYYRSDNHSVMVPLRAWRARNLWLPLPGWFA